MRRLALLCLSLLVSGCVVHTAGVDAITTMATEKTLTDHVVSLASGKDCSSVRSEMGLTYCKEDEKIPPMNVYCYHTLGSVNCYSKPVYDGEQQRIGQGNDVPSPAPTK